MFLPSLAMPFSGGQIGSHFESRNPGTRSDPVEGTAVVVPHQPWTTDGSADVTPLNPFPDTTTRELPLEHRPGGAQTISRLNYPSGLVVIWDDSEVAGPSAQLHVFGSSGGQVVLIDDGHRDYPDGVIVWFLN